ncbi:MAG TPA: STAS domain-containing protein [Acidisarcina sp.]
MSLETDINQLSPTTAVVTLRGRLSLGINLSLLQAQLTTLIDRGTNQILLDMGQVDHIDSAALGMIVHINGEVRTHIGELRVVAPQARVLGLFKMTGTNHLLNIYQDKGSALAGFNL